MRPAMACVTLGRREALTHLSRQVSWMVPAGSASQGSRQETLISEQSRLDWISTTREVSKIQATRSTPSMMSRKKGLKGGRKGWRQCQEHYESLLRAWLWVHVYFVQAFLFFIWFNLRVTIGWWSVHTPKGTLVLYVPACFS